MQVSLNKTCGSLAGFRILSIGVSLLIFSLASLGVSACATPPAKVTPSPYVGPPLAEISCDGLEKFFVFTQKRKVQIEIVLKDISQKDRRALTVDLLSALGNNHQHTTSGKDISEPLEREYSRMLGRAAAIELEMISRC